MALQRWRAITAPRDKDTTAKQGSEVLARWLATTEQARHDETYHQYWQIYNSVAFADLWYEARAAGERVRARAVAHLYAHRAKPGGAHPDPRAAAAFSERAILTTAAHLEGITVRTYRLTAEDEEQQQQGQQRLPLAWIATYPPARSHPNSNTPQLWLHPPTRRFTQARIFFEMACLLGYVTKERRILDPNAPHGVTMLPDEQGLVALMHQFAFALLHLEPACPEEWGCHCNLIRAQFTAPPADHDQPTETLSLADLAQHTRAPDHHR